MLYHMADTKCVLNQRQTETSSVSLALRGENGRGTAMWDVGNVVSSDSCVQLRGVSVSGRGGVIASHILRG